MKILLNSEIDRAEWSALVQNSATGTWFQTPEAYDFYAGQPELFRPFAVGIVAYPQPLPERRGEEANPQPPHDSFASVWGAHTADSTQYNLLKANAIANRKTPTEAESVMWDLLKGNNLGLHFRRQHIILDYIVDFICLDKGLVIELDGGYHNDLQQKEYDEQRTAHLQKLGYTELRFTNEELLVNPEEVIAKIKAVAESLPSLQGRTEERPVLRGVCVGYITVEKSAFKQMMTRRAIIVGGPALADNCSEEEVAELMSAVRKQLKSEAIYVECRNFNDYSKWKTAFEKAGFEYVPHLNFHIDTSSMEVVDANLGKSRKRDIRTTIREGVSVIEQPTDEQVCEYYKVLDSLYSTKVKTPLFPLSFFLELNNHKDGRLLLMEYQGRIIGGTVCVEQANKCVYEWFVCGEDGVYPHVFPSCYATYAGIKYAAEHGCKKFDMMGAGKPDEAYGVRDFKAKFGGKEVEHGRFLCITKPLLYRIGVFGVMLLKKLK